MLAALALPQLAIAFPNIDPVLFQIGPFAVRWYSLGYIIGILAAWYLGKRMVQNPKLWDGRAPVSVADLDDFILWATLGIVLGGRIGYVLFYDLGSFLANPASIFAVWQGGMSFHGGLIGTTLAMLFFARSRGIDPWRMFDLIGALAPIGIGLVRVANFINGELWGRPSDAPWSMVFPADPLQVTRHPSQLYEAFLEGLVLYFILRIATHRALMLKYPRFVTGLFVGGYGAARTFVEFFREPDPQIGFLFGGWLTMGMLLSIPMIVLGLALMASARQKAARLPDLDDAETEA